MALRQLNEKLDSGELTRIHLNGVNTDNEVVIRSDLSNLVTEAPLGSIQYGRVDEGWDAIPTDNMKWKGTWSPGAYFKHNVVRDDSWTMVANKDTDDRPAPTPYGDKGYLLPNIPEWIHESVVDAVWSGLRISGLSDTYLIDRVRAFLPAVSADDRYRVVVKDNLNGQLIVGQEYPGTILAAPGWLDVAVDPFWMMPGMDVTAYLLTQNSSTTTNFNYPWAYNGSSNPEAPPGLGLCERNNGKTIIRISKTDSNALDRTFELLSAFIPNTKLKIAQVSDTNRSSEYSIQAWTEYTTYVSYDVVFVEDGSSGEPSTGAPCQVYFEVPIAGSAAYVRMTDEYAGKLHLNGQLIIGDAAEVVTQDAYGIDVQFQKYIASEDWDMVAHSVATGSSVAADMTYDFFKADPAPDLSNVYQSLGKLITPFRAAGTFEFKMSWEWGINSTSNSGFFRYQVNENGVWYETQYEIKDGNNRLQNSYFFPVVLGDGVKTLEFQARKELSANTMDVRFCDLVIQRVK